MLVLYFLHLFFESLTIKNIKIMAKKNISEEITTAIKAVVERINTLSLEIKLPAYKTLFFGDGGKWQGLKQILVTFESDPLSADTDPSMSGQIRKQLSLLSSLYFSRKIQVPSTAPYTSLAEVIYENITRIFDGNFENIADDHGFTTRIFVLRGFIFGTGTNLVSDKYQGLKQALVSAERLDSSQSWVQIHYIEHYLD